MARATSLAARRLKIAELSANIFGNVFNPKGVRQGNYILRQNFRGEHIRDYYPSDWLKKQSKTATVNKEANFSDAQIEGFLDSWLEKKNKTVDRLERKGLKRTITQSFNQKYFDPDEIDRREVIERRQARGKGAPKKGKGKRSTLGKKR